MGRKPSAPRKKVGSVSIIAFAIIAALSLVAAPATAQAPAPTMMPMAKNVHAIYSCHNLKVPVTYDNVKMVAKITYGSKHFALPHVMSADGSRYMNSTLEWWSKGSAATLSSVADGKAETVLATCTSIPTK